MWTTTTSEVYIIRYTLSNLINAHIYMSNVEFEEGGGEGLGEKKILYSRFDLSNNIPTLVRFLLKTRVVRTRRQADFVLLGIVIVFVALTILTFYQTTRPNLSEAGRVEVDFPDN